MSFSSTALLQSMIGATGNSFSHPYIDVASQYTPQNIGDAFKWAEYLYYKMGTVRSATDRIVHYILTEVQYGGEKNEVVDKYEALLEDKLDVRGKTLVGGIDLLTYGNRLCSMYFPFDRFFICPNCKFEMKATDTDFTLVDLKFKVTCRCKYKGIVEHVDRPVRDPDRVEVIRWNPKDIELEFHPVSQRKQYYWKIPANIIKKIKSGDPFLINWMPWEIIKCIHENKVFKFAHGQIFHQALPSLAGVTQEWGVPPSIAIFTLAWYVQIMRRMNEAIANDFIIPFRILHPLGSSASSDPATFVAMGNFVGQMKDMVRSHRRDPADVQVSPIPIGYQAMGGEGKALDLSGNIKASNEEILNSLGFPSELWYGTLSVQALPAALRMFENHWHTLINANNRFIQWVTKKVSAFFDWELIDVKYRPLKIADDIERRQILMQLASAQQISSITAMKQYGLDFKEEQEKLIEQQQIMQEMQRRTADVQKEMAENAADTGQGVPSGSPTVYDIEGQATQLAQQLVGMSTAGQQGEVDRMLSELSQSSYTLYTQVKDKMEKLRTQANSEAGRQALQQNFAPMAPGGVTGQGGPPQGGMQ